MTLFHKAGNKQSDIMCKESMNDQCSEGSNLRRCCCQVYLWIGHLHRRQFRLNFPGGKVNKEGPDFFG